MSERPILLRGDGFTGMNLFSSMDHHLVSGHSTKDVYWICLSVRLCLLGCTWASSLTEIKFGSHLLHWAHENLRVNWPLPDPCTLIYNAHSVHGFSKALSAPSTPNTHLIKIRNMENCSVMSWNANQLSFMSASFRCEWLLIRSQSRFQIF